MRVDENNYIKELKRGNEDALNFIIDIYLPLVKGITYKVLSKYSDKQLMEECINDIFMAVWNNSKKFNGEKNNFKSWIAKISKFKAIDYYRKISKKVEVPSYDIDLGYKIHVEDDILNSENKKEIINLINTLDNLDRDIFIMKYFMGMSVRSICKEKGITESAINNRVYRCKRKLKEKAPLYLKLKEEL